MKNDKNPPTPPENPDGEPKEPVVRDRRRVDPVTGSVRRPRASGKAGAKSAASGQAAEEATDAPADGDKAPGTPLSQEDQTLLDQAAADLVAEMRDEMLRAHAELINFRTRVERDRAANRETVIAEVIRALLPALDDLDRAEAHGDLEGTPLAIVAQKLRGGFEKFGLHPVGEKGQPFDPKFHEAVVQVPSPDVTVNTVAEVLEPGYALGDRLVRAAKVAVSVPAE